MREDWIEITLDDIAKWGSGGTPKSTIPEYYDGDIPWLIIGDLNDSYVSTSEKKITELGLKNSSAKWVKADSVLIAMYGSIGKLGINKIPVTTNQAIAFTQTLYGDIQNKYLFYYLLLCRPKLHKVGKGGTQKNISQTVLKTIDFPLAPLLEQKAIVAKIEQLFSELDNAVANLKTAKAKLKIYRQAVLKKAFEGELTKANKHNWKLHKIGDICDCIVPNRDKPKSFSGKTKWVTTPNLNQDSIKVNYSAISLGLSDEELVSYKAKVIPKGSVIMTCVGTFGVSAIVEEEIVINQQLHAFLPNEKILSKFLAYLIKYNKNYLEKKATATTVAYLNKANCNSIPVYLPSLEEQNQIVQEIESRLSVCDKIEETIETSLAKSEALRQSILKKAFEGKLLSEQELENIKNHPEYESVQALLKIIKNERDK